LSPQRCFVLEEMLAVENIRVRYGTGRATVRALDEVSLKFYAGQMALVMGPSGSGKTTLLSTLGCLLTPNDGRVVMMGNDVTALTEDQRGRLRQQHIGYIFQAFRLFRALSALENILVAMDIAGRKDKASRELAMQALAEVGLADRWRLKPKELSGGEKQRVAIARALINNPQIILADEPTASLDGKAGGQIAEMMLQIAEARNRLVVVVSHDPRMIQFGHRIIRMQDGRLLSDEKNNGRAGENL
jgi:putative ABC transport system ATP-binding protein